MRLESRVAKLEAVTTAAEVAYGMWYLVGGVERVYVCGTGECLTPGEWAARYSAGLIVKRLVGLDPHDLL